MGGVDKGSMFVWYVSVNHANVRTSIAIAHPLYMNVLREQL